MRVQTLKGDNFSPLHWLGLLLVVFMVGVLYAPVVPGMVSDWYHDPNYSHGFLIPLIAAYFAWERWPQLKEAEYDINIWGLVVIAGSLLLLVFGYAGTEYFSMRVSLVFLLAGLLLYFCGFEVLRILVLPLVFLLFMVPLPYIVYDALAFPLKLLVTKYSVAALKFLGIVVWREGNIIIFPETVLEVADACSGMRSLMSLLAISTAYAFMLKSSNRRRLLLLLLALPIAVLTNMLRVIGTGILAQYYGAAAAQGFFHEFAGLVVFGLAMALLILVGTFLSRGK